MHSRLMRPITVLAVSAKANTKALLHACEPFDLNPDEAMLGLRKGYQCAELISAMRLFVERSLEWQTPLFFAQLDFAKAYYDSVIHTAVWRIMRRRSVPEVLVCRISGRYGLRSCVSNKARGRRHRYARSLGCDMVAECRP